MFNPLQPSFKIRIFDNKQKEADIKKTGATASNEYIDIEACVAYPVTYEESADLLTHLNFTVDKFADILLYYFHIGQRILLKGGYYSDNENSYRDVFSGTVTRIRTRFTEEGRVTFSVECMSYGFTRLGKNPKNFVYPDKKSSRSFAQAEQMSVSDIIKGIAKENNLAIGIIDLSTEARKVNYDKISVRYQKNMTDWAFLKQLANDMGCSVWLENDGGGEKLYFMSHEKVFSKQQSDISFLYPLAGYVEDVKDSEMQKFDDPAYNRPRLLTEVNVDEDISAAYSVSRSAVYFDKETGEEKSAVARVEEKDGKKRITFYELDEERVRYVHENMPEIADKIREGGPTDMPWGDENDPNCAAYYYKAVTYYEEHQAVFDKAFFGITMTAKCNQDLNIRSQRTYKVRGILSYHSKDKETSFYLRGLKHIWDSDGNWTELDFIR